MSELKSALVTGATGFIGGALCRQLASRGVSVVCPIRAESPRSAHLGRLSNVRVVPLSSFDRETLRAALAGERFEAVFHLAAYGVAPSERDPNAMVDGNVGLTANLIHAATDWSPRRLVFAGTCSEYAPAADGTRLTEDHPIAPTTLYGAAKAAAHVYGRTLAASLGLDFVGARIFGTYGVGEAPHRLVRYLIEHFRAGTEPALTPGQHRRDLSYVDDVVDALIVAATHSGLKAGEVYNVCSGEPHTIAEVAKRVAELMGKPDVSLGLGRREYRADEPMWLIGDPSRFAKATGWSNQISLDDGIRRMIDALG